MFTKTIFSCVQRLRLRLILTGLACAWLTSVVPVAHATLVLDPVANMPMARGSLSVSPPLSNGFVPVVFRPVTDDSRQVVSWPLAVSIPPGSTALHWHMQNAMPWPVTIDLSLADASGGALTTRLALPPGPPQTIVVPLRSVEPLAFGMRASPPPNFNQNEEPFLVATSIQGALRDSVKSVSISMPTPDANQTILLGKLFLAPGENVLKSLYTDLMDCFGQFTRHQWPGKKEGQCGLDPTRKNPSSPDSHSVPPDITSDRFGGLLLPGWPAATLASGTFRTYRVPDESDDKPGRWILLSPLGNPFFSLGVNALQLNNSETFIEGREFMFAALPDDHSPLAAFYGQRDSTDVLPADAGAQQGRGFRSGRTYDFYRANLYRADGPKFPQLWQHRTRERLRRWSFNTAAAWSDENFIRKTDLSYTAIIHVEGPFQRLSDGHNWWQGIPDPFDPAFRQALQNTFVKAVSKHRNSQRLIGYFVDNELAWGDGSASDPSSRYGPVLSALAMNTKDNRAFAKRAFLEHLQKQYGTIDRLARAWQLPFDSWQLLELPVLNDRVALRKHLESNPVMASDLSELLSLHAREYFKLVAGTLRSFDPDHLYLGSRFASRTPEAVSACVRFCDVVSFNLYVPDISSGFEAEAFANHDVPALLTEFHFGSADRGPFWDGVMSVASEHDRGPAYQHMIDSVLANRQFVGAHWFQYLDQPATGRWLDGENGHLGLVSISDAPWREFTTIVSNTNKAALRQIAKQLRQSTR